MRLTKKEIKEHQAIWDKHGRERLMEVTGMSRPAVNHWRKRGFPRGWFAVVSGLPNKAAK